jgi:Family of unknown function (DUF5906)
MPACHRPPSINVEGHESDEMQSEALPVLQSQPEPMSESDTHSDLADQDDTGEEADNEGNETRPGTFEIPQGPSLYRSSMDPGPSLHRSSMDPGMLHSDDEPPPVEGVIPLDDDDPSYNTYDLVKIRFEKEAFKVQDPFCYARIKNEQGELTMFDHVKFTQYYMNWKYWELEGGYFVQQDHFIKKWLLDPVQRVVRGIVVDPSNLEKNVYNLWQGPIASRLPPVDPDQVNVLIERVVNHIREVVANGNEEHTQWFLDWMANLIQRPWSPSRVAILLYGKQGSGKDIILDWLCEYVIGEFAARQTDKPVADLLDRFATGLVHKTLVVIDEPKDMHQHDNPLKNIITCKMIPFEEKFRQQITVKNFSNLIFTSNYENVLSVPSDDRRFVLFHCSNKYKGMIREYFQPLADYIQTPEVTRAFYQFCMNRNLSAYPGHFQGNRPITQFYKDIQQLNLPIFQRFISAVVNYLEYFISTHPELHDKILFVYSSDLQDQFEQFARQERVSSQVMKSKTFGMKMSHLDGSTPYKRTNKNAYKLNVQELKQGLIEDNEYDHDANLNIPEDQSDIFHYKKT